MADKVLVTCPTSLEEGTSPFHFSLIFLARHPWENHGGYKYCYVPHTDQWGYLQTGICQTDFQDITYTVSQNYFC